MRILMVVYDNGSFTSWFPQGLAYIAAVLEKEGYYVEIYNQDLHHYPDEHLTSYLDNNHFDFVCVSLIAGYYQYRKLKKISAAINASKDRPKYLIGGHGPAPCPDYFFEISQADAIVIGEGEITILELLDAIANSHDLNLVEGIAFRDIGGNTIQTKRREQIEDIDTIPFPAYHLFPIELYRMLRLPRTDANDFAMPVLSGRGCTFKCNFCYRLDKGFRGRCNETIIEEILYLKKEYGITYIAFSDELLMVNKPRTISICEALIKAKVNIKWNCNGRLNFAVPEVLNLMKKAGCVYINYGIESMDNEVLKRMKKGLRVDMVEKGIKATLDVGISPGFNLIYGHIGDTLETLEKSVKFLLENDDGADMRTLRPVTPYPGSPLYYDAIKMGKLKDCRDFYENKHVNSDLLAVNFTKLTDDQFHEALFDANRRLVNNYFENQKINYLEQMEELYIGMNTEFRGFRHSHK